MNNLDRIIRSGTNLGDWQVTGFVDIGGSGRVYTVTNRFRAGLIGALKHRIDGGAVTAPEFEEEIAFLKTSDVPEATLRFYADGTHEGERWYIMEWADPLGEDLSPKQALRTFTSAADTLALFHEAGHCHGDIKCANLGWARGKVRLLDAGRGASCLPEKDPKPLVTTTAYASEDVLRKCRATREGDVYALALAMNKACGPRARSVFALAIKNALNPLNGSRTLTAKAFKEDLLKCYRQRTPRRVISTTIIALASVLLGVGVYFRMSYDNRREVLIEQFKDENAAKSHVELVHFNYDDPKKRDTAKAFRFCEKALANEAALDDKDKGYIHGVMAECYWLGDGCERNRDSAFEHAQKAMSLGDLRGTDIIGRHK